MEFSPNESPARPQERTDDTSQEELMALWRVARQEALRRCARTLARLRRGEGGFYGEDDFWQDLFLEFWNLARRWQAEGQPQEELWATWRRMLWGGGIRVLKRTPQRLWSGNEWPVEPERMDLAEPPDEAEDGLATRSPLPSSAVQALIQPEDAEETHAQLTTLEQLEDALWALRPLQRQMIYMAVLAEMPAAQVADCLGLKSANSVYQRLHAARAALRRHVKRARAKSAITAQERGGSL